MMMTDAEDKGVCRRWRSIPGALHAQRSAVSSGAAGKLRHDEVLVAIDGHGRALARRKTRHHIADRAQARPITH